MSRAEPMKRGVELDVLECPACHGSMKRNPRVFGWGQARASRGDAEVESDAVGYIGATPNFQPMAPIRVPGQGLDTWGEGRLPSAPTMVSDVVAGSIHANLRSKKPMRYKTLPFVAITFLTSACGDDSTDDSTTAASATAAADGTDSASQGEVVEIMTEAGVFEFFPSDITINVGDTVRFILTPDHNLVEVSMETYDARLPNPLAGGFSADFGATVEITFDEPGMHWFVCQPHVSLDHVGTITVQ